MEYLREALVDIAESLFQTPWILLKIMIDSYALILLDIIEEEMNNLVRFREHFMEEMRDKRLDDVEGTHGVKYLEEQELESSALRNLWRKCLGVDIENDSSMMLFPFPTMRRILSFLKNYHEDHTQETSSSQLNTKKRNSITFMSCTTAPGQAEVADGQSYKDLESFLEQGTSSGPVNSLDHTFKISQVMFYGWFNYNN